MKAQLVDGVESAWALLKKQQDTETQTSNNNEENPRGWIPSE